MTGISAKITCGKIGLLSAMMIAAGLNASAEDKASPTILNCVAHSMEVNLDVYDNRSDRHIRKIGKYTLDSLASHTLKGLKVSNFVYYKLHVRGEEEGKLYVELYLDTNKDHALVQVSSKQNNPFRYRLKPLKDGKCPS